MKVLMLAVCFCLCRCALPAAASPGSLEAAVNGVVLRHLLGDLRGADAKKSIRGAKALWIQVGLQKPLGSTDMNNLEKDIKLTEVEGPLRNAGFKIMDPKKRSLALGLRPTLFLNVLFCPKGTEGNEQDFYLLLIRASQNVLPLGGETVTLTTWMKLGEAIPSAGDKLKDIDAIRASARSLVASFINVAQDKDDAEAPAQ
jgi:hypothetical protein